MAAEAEIIITGEIHGTSAVNQEGAPVRAVIGLAAAYRILFLRLLQALREKSATWYGSQGCVIEFFVIAVADGINKESVSSLSPR